MYEKWRGLGVANIIRCLEANGINRDYYDIQEYDASLTPGENIALATERFGVRTVRAERAVFSKWQSLY
jgi:hypothetical protein